MQQQLRLGALVLEERIAGDRVVADQVALEVVVDRGREDAELGRGVVAPDAGQHLGVAVELLEEQGDGPARDHPVAHVRVGRLQRVVPVALAVADEVRAGDEPLAHGREQLVDMDRDRVALLGRLERVVLPPGHRLVENGEVVGRLDVVAERLQRPDDHVAMAVPVADLRVGLDHEPLRPVAARRLLLGEDDPHDLPHRRVVLEREQELDRALADVAGAPGSAAELLEAVRHGEVDHRVVRQPREERVERGDALAVAGEAEAARHLLPVSPRRRQHRGILDASCIFRGQAVRLRGIVERSDDGEAQRLGLARAERDVGAARALRRRRRAARRRRWRRRHRACR